MVLRISTVMFSARIIRANQIAGKVSHWLYAQLLACEDLFSSIRALTDPREALSQFMDYLTALVAVGINDAWV